MEFDGTTSSTTSVIQVSFARNLVWLSFTSRQNSSDTSLRPQTHEQRSPGITLGLNTASIKSILVDVMIPLHKPFLPIPSGSQQIHQSGRPPMGLEKATRQRAIQAVKRLAIVHGKQETMLMKGVKNLNDVHIDIVPRDTTNLSRQSRSKPGAERSTTADGR